MTGSSVCISTFAYTLSCMFAASHVSWFLGWSSVSVISLLLSIIGSFVLVVPVPRVSGVRSPLHGSPSCQAACVVWYHEVTSCFAVPGPCSVFSSLVCLVSLTLFTCSTRLFLLINPLVYLSPVFHFLVVTLSSLAV